MESSDQPPGWPAKPGVPRAGQATKPDVLRTPGTAIAGGVCGVIAAVASIIPFLGMLLTPLPALAAIVLGAVGLRQAQKRGAPKAWAVVALIGGIGGLVVMAALAELSNGWT